MERAIATLVLTRPLPAARRVARSLRAAGWSGAMLFSPILEIAPIEGAALPAGTLVFTSQNGVLAAARRGSLAGRSAVAVGDRTARAANRLGARCRSACGDVDDLAALLRSESEGPYIHCRGLHSVGDLAGRLRAAGIEADELVVYDQVPVPLSDAADRALCDTRPAVLPLYSPRSARLVGAAMSSSPTATMVVALSARVAAAWPWDGAVRVAPGPEAAAMSAVLRGLVGWDGAR